MVNATFLLSVTLPAFNYLLSNFIQFDYDFNWNEFILHCLDGWPSSVSFLICSDWYFLQLFDVSTIFFLLLLPHFLQILKHLKSVIGRFRDQKSPFSNYINFSIWNLIFNIYIYVYIFFSVFSRRRCKWVPWR